MSCLYCYNTFQNNDGLKNIKIIYGDKYDNDLINKLNNDIKVKFETLEFICNNCFEKFYNKLVNKIYVNDKNNYSLTELDNSYKLYGYQTDYLEILKVKTIVLKNKKKVDPITLDDKINNIKNKITLLNDKLNKLVVLNSRQQKRVNLENGSKSKKEKEKKKKENESIIV